MSRSDWRGAAVRLVHLAAFAWLGPVSICLAADASSEMKQIREAALTHYDEGRPVTASDTLRTALRAKADSLPQKELIVSYGFLADVCTSLRDPMCVMEAAQGMRKAATKPLSPSDERFLFYLTTLTLHFANQLPAGAVDLMEKVGPQKFDPVEESLLYVKMSFLAAQILVAKDRPAAARTWLDGGLSVLLTSRNIGGYYVASYLVQAMKIMLDLGQYARADYYWRISHDYVRRTVPSTSIEALDLDWVIYVVGEQLGNKALVETSARNGINTLERLEVPNHLGNWYKDGFARGAAAICAIAGDWDCSDFFMAKHPLRDSADKLLNPAGQFQSDNAALFALISTLRDAFRGQNLNASWKPAFESLAEEHVSTTTAKTYATWVLGLYEFNNQSPRFRQRFIDAARLKLHDIEGRINAEPTVFWLPELYDRVILWAGALAASASPAPSQDEVELAVRAIEVGNRSLRYFGVDSFDASTTTLEAQNQLQTQAVTQLLVRFSAWEKQRLVALVSDVGTQSSPGQSEDTLDSLQYTYTIFVEQIAALAQKVRKDGRTSIPDLTDLQGLLDENEVLVARSSFAGATSFTCIKKSTAKLVHHHLGGDAFKQALLDLRVLNAALADERTPSDELDSQFPFGAAQRVYRLLFEPIHSSCLKDGDRVIWVDGSDATFPVHALSSNVPPGKDGFYDLAMAKWLGRAYAFSYVASLSHFAAARRETRRARFASGYLGVGNPVLAGETADGTTTFGKRIASRSARSATAGLVSLSQLPETEKEIQGLSSHFETNQSKVLLGPDATEANFRRQLLSEYGVIHFATHGVIGEELAGLTEPALVLTPVSERIQSNDGLLTASEISQLALRARLVVLSACNTANFAVSLFGNEFQGLSTAFLIAGSPTMMLTLWPVDSVTSETVVGQAVSSAVDSGMPIDKALSAALFQQAEKSGRKAYLHPRFWAPFVIFGDGSVTLAKRLDKLTRPRFSVQTFDALEGGGELLSVVRVPMSDDIVMSGRSGLQDNRYKSLIQRVGPDGAVIWRQQDAKIAGGSVIVWGSSVLVSGYLSEPERTWIPTLSRYTLGGKLLWTKRLPVPDDAAVFAMSNEGGQDANVVLSLTDNGWAGRARLLRIAGDGTVRRELDLPLPEKARTSSAVIFHEGPNTIVHLTFSLSNKTGKVWRDLFSRTRLCNGEYGTARIVVSDSDNRVLETTYLSSTNFESGLDVGGRRFLAGSTYDPCTFASSAKLSEDGSVAARTVYSDDAPTSSSLRALVGDSPTRLFGFGNSWTIVDPSRLSWTQNTGLKRLDEVMLEVAHSQRSNYLVEVDPTTRKTKVYDFSAGVALHIAAATKVGDQLVAVGAVGGQPALLRVQLPPP